MYSMAIEIKNVQVPWGGLQEVYVSMNNMAKLEGTVRWFDMFGNLRPLPWAQISATNPSYSWTSSTSARILQHTAAVYGAVGAGSS